MRIKDFPLLYPRRLTKRLNQSGEIDADQTRVIAEALIELFPAA